MTNKWTLLLALICNTSWSMDVEKPKATPSKIIRMKIRFQKRTHRSNKPVKLKRCKNLTPSMIEITEWVMVEKQ